VAGSTPDMVIDFFSMRLILPTEPCTGVYSASNRNKYHKISGGKARTVSKADKLTDNYEPIV
jgi:hypothetical protein